MSIPWGEQFGNFLFGDAVNADICGGQGSIHSYEKTRMGYRVI